jgi:hypothetical protein
MPDHSIEAVLQAGVIRPPGLRAIWRIYRGR